MSADDRAHLMSMMAERYPEYAVAEEGGRKRAGPLRRFMRWVIGLLSLGVVATLAWYAVAVSWFPDAATGALTVPMPLVAGVGVLSIILLLWFDGRLGWTLMFLLGLGLIGGMGISMRWIDSTSAGVGEYWAGVELQRVRLTGNICYRISPEVFELRGAQGRVFSYQRLIWPGSFSEPEFRRYFFSDAAMQMGADGWNCVKRG